MITLNLDWHEVLWWVHGGMAGSHLRWNVYEDMVNKVWPQCSEAERGLIFSFMRRDLGLNWRPEGWSGWDLDAPGEGPWREDIYDKTPWEYFRHVLARFNPDNQYAVTAHVKNREELDGIMRYSHMGCLIDWPKPHVRDVDWESATATVRTYKWQDEYHITWNARLDPERITKVEKITINV